MASGVRRSLEQRAQRAILQHAVFRWESAAAIALTLLLSFFMPQSGLPVLQSVPGWAWLVGGLLGEGALVWSSLTDQKTAERVVAEMLRDEFRPERLQDKTLQRQMNEALQYHKRLADLVRERDASVLSDSLNETVRQIDDWLEEVYDLARRIDAFKKEKPLLDRELAEAQERLEELKAAQAREVAPRLKEDIGENISSLERKIETIRKLNDAMQRAQLRLEHTLIAISTIHSQAMLAEAKGIDSSRAQRLRHEIGEEVSELGDILTAMDEVYAASSSEVA